MLPPDRRERAIIASTAPFEIITGNDREARLERFEGLPVADMTAAERSVLKRLILEYLRNMPEDVAEQRFAKIQEEFDALWFAWAGPLEPGAGHYYRIHGPAILFEYDNMQNRANHVHSASGGISKTISGETSCGGTTTSAPTIDAASRIYTCKPLSMPAHSLSTSSCRIFSRCLALENSMVTRHPTSAVQHTSSNEAYFSAFPNPLVAVSPDLRGLWRRAGFRTGAAAVFYPYHGAGSG